MVHQGILTKVLFVEISGRTEAVAAIKIPVEGGIKTIKIDADVFK